MGSSWGGMREQNGNMVLLLVVLLGLLAGVGIYFMSHHSLKRTGESNSQEGLASEQGERTLSSKESPLPKVVVKLKVPLQKKWGKGFDYFQDGEYFFLLGSHDGKDPEGKLQDKDVCQRTEYRGDGLQNSQISKTDFMKVAAQFLESKRLLKAWLAKYRDKMSDETVAFMEQQLERVQLVAPPSFIDPDLSWRGIGVWTRDEIGAPLIRLSSGFVKLVNKQPKRAQFEMTRLVSQSWAPCELDRVDTKSPWNSFLKCLEVVDEDACSSGSYSEGGWAVSTGLAAILSPPDCTLPIFKDSNRNQCLQNIEIPPAELLKRLSSSHERGQKE